MLKFGRFWNNYEVSALKSFHFRCESHSLQLSKLDKESYISVADGRNLGFLPKEIE